MLCDLFTYIHVCFCILLHYLCDLYENMYVISLTKMVISCPSLVLLYPAYELNIYQQVV